VAGVRRDTLTPALADRLDFIRDPFEDRDDADRGPAILAEARSVLWTPTVTVTARQLEGHLPLLCRRFNAVVERHLNPRADYLSDAWHVERC
jgi:hypothetical protein